MTYRIGSADGGTVEALCRLFGEVFHHRVESRTWRWKYHDTALSDSLNICLYDQDTLVGHAGAVVLPGATAGHAMRFAQVCDVMLSPAARGGAGPNGPYACLMKGLIEAMRARCPDAIHYGFPGVRPFSLGERLGFYRATGPIREQVLAAKPSWKRLWRLCELEWTDARVEGLSAQMARRPGWRLLRDRNYLDWRYARHPVRRYRLLGLRSGFALVGWLVVSRDGEVLRVIDHCLTDERLRECLPVLQAQAAVEGAATVVFWSSGHDALMLPGVTVRDTGMIGVVMPSSAPEYALCNPLWQPGDTDVS